MGSFGETRKNSLFRFCRPILDMFRFVYVIAWGRGQLRINFTSIFKVFIKFPESLLKTPPKYRKLDYNKNNSKETYGQTRGLSNLEMKYVGKLAIIGALLKAKQAEAVFVPCKVALI